MTPTPDWVKKLKPAGPQGSELLQQEREQSNVSVDKLGDLIHTRKTLERQERILSILEKEEVFDKSQNHSLGRVERVTRSLAKAKRLQNLRVQHQWTQDDFMTANELMSEPTPYGLHASMFLVSLKNGSLCQKSGADRISCRSRSEIKELQNSINCFLNARRSMRSSVAMRRLSWAMGPMYVVWRQPPPGTRPIKPLSSTRRRSLPQNGGLALLGEQQIMPL